MNSPYAMQRFLGSCVLKAWSVECLLIPSTNTLVDWHGHWYLVDTQLTLDQQSVVSRASVDQLICLDRKLVHCELRCQWGAHWVSTKVYRLRCWSSVLIEGINQQLTSDANIAHDVVSPEFAHCIVSYKLKIYRSYRYFFAALSSA